MVEGGSEGRGSGAKEFDGEGRDRYDQESLRFCYCPGDPKGSEIM